MQYGIDNNIVNIANQLSFAYQGIAPELKIYILASTKITKASNFIRALEKKQEV